MSNTFFNDINIIENDSKKIECIDKLRQALHEVRKTYHSEYRQSLNHVLENIKSKMMHNKSMVDAVEMYVTKYVPTDKQPKAKDELYDMLAAEVLQTMHVVHQTSCTIM